MVLEEKNLLRFAPGPMQQLNNYHFAEIGHDR
jgi:hypothetical protein